jgi:GNAT superfamily N-acetyltransferase
VGGLSRRIRDFELSILDGLVSRVVPFEYGRAFFDEDLPDVWDDNFLLVEGGRPSASDLAGWAEGLQGTAGLRHRKIAVPDEDLGRRMTAELASLGYSVTRLLSMALGAGEAGAADTSFVEELDLDAAEPAVRAFYSEAPFGADAAAVEQLLERRRRVASVVDVRRFGVVVDGLVVSTCELYCRGDTAQIEDVATLGAHRGRGYGSAVVAKAIREALSDEHNLVFLVADAHGRPRELYSRLGFEPVAVTYEFVRSLEA